jgi:transposase
MRKSFDALCGLVISVMQRQPTSGEVFVFLNRSRTHIKLLHWEHGGFVLYYKRLEQGMELQLRSGDNFKLPFFDFDLSIFPLD